MVDKKVDDRDVASQGGSFFVQGPDCTFEGSEDELSCTDSITATPPSECSALRKAMTGRNSETYDQGNWGKSWQNICPDDSTKA